MLEHLRSDLEREIEKDRRPPFPRWLLLGRLPSSSPVVADRSDSFLETVFWFFGGYVAVRSRGCRRWWAFGVGLGGGYRTPPN